MNWSEGIIDGVIVRPLRKHVDARGWLTELVRSDEMPPDIFPVMAYVSETRPGVQRGPHAHIHQTDTFACLGPGTFRVRMWDNRPSSPTYGRMQTILAGRDQPLTLTVPPHVVHAYVNVSQENGWVLNFPNRLYAGPGKKEPVDEIRYEDDPSATFQMEGPG